MYVIAESQRIALTARRSPAKPRITAFAQLARIFYFIHFVHKPKIHVALRQNARYVFFVAYFFFVQRIHLCWAGRNKEYADIVRMNPLFQRLFLASFAAIFAGAYTLSIWSASS